MARLIALVCAVGGLVLVGCGSDAATTTTTTNVAATTTVDTVDTVIDGSAPPSGSTVATTASDPASVTVDSLADATPATDGPTTTVAPTSTVASALTAERLDLGPACTGAACPSLAARSDGVLVSFDATTAMITIHDTPVVTFAVQGLGAGTTGHVALIGPDDVVYLAMQHPGDDPVGDLLAVSTAAGNAGTVVGRADGAVDMSGDSTLVAASTGVVAVGCCDFAPRRPAADAAVVSPWYDRGGNVITSSGLDLWVEFGTDGAVTVVREDGDAEVSWTIGDVQFGRGMPAVARLDDGGVLIDLTDSFDPTSPSRVVALLPDGSELETSIAPYASPVLEPDGSIVALQDGSYVRLRPFGVLESAS